MPLPYNVDVESIPLVQNKLGLELRKDLERGRGVFATQKIKSGTLVDISPILLFQHDEYDKHGKHTALDHYTYRWQNGYALALGLGSMFNHSNEPNVGYVRDLESQIIRYTTLHDIEPNDELCISYGSNLWFKNTEDGDEQQREAAAAPESSAESYDWLGAMEIS